MSARLTTILVLITPCWDLSLFTIIDLKIVDFYKTDIKLYASLYNYTEIFQNFKAKMYGKFIEKITAN